MVVFYKFHSPTPMRMYLRAGTRGTSGRIWIGSDARMIPRERRGGDGKWLANPDKNNFSGSQGWEKDLRDLTSSN